MKPNIILLASLNISDARLKFALRTCMTRTVQANFKGDPNFRSNNWKCQDCQVLDTGPRYSLSCVSKPKNR